MINSALLHAWVYVGSSAEQRPWGLDSRSWEERPPELHRNWV